MNIENDRVADAFFDFCMQLYGRVPEPYEYASITVARSDYKKAMQDVEEKHGITEGDSDFFMWLLLLLARTPKIMDDEGDKGNGQSSETETVG